MDNYNVIFIVGDGLQTRLGCYGYPKPTSPFIDNLARRGVLFENCYSCTNHTDPSFTTIFSGRYPITHGITRHDFRANRYTHEDLKILDKTGVKFLPEILKNKGYTTVAFDWLGRWHKKGFDYYEETFPKFSFRGIIEKKLTSVSPKLSKKVKRFFHKIGIPLPARSGVCYTNSAIRFIKKNPKKKFFMLIHNWDTHTPFDILPMNYIHKFYEKKSDKTVEEMLEKLENEKWKEIVTNYHLYGVKYLDEIPALYDGAVNLFDNTVKKLVKCLEKTGILEKTIIIITGDHGDNPLRDGMFIGHFGLYESVIHVPLIIFGPGFSGGKRIKGFVQHTDIFPTILENLGIDYNKFEPDGKSLFSLIKGKEESRRSSVLAIDGATSKRYTIRTNRYHYIHSMPDNKPFIEFDLTSYGDKNELYDLKKDPEEKNNIVNKDPRKANQLKEKLLSQVRELERKKSRLIKKNK